MNTRIQRIAEQAGLSEGVFTRHDSVPCNLKGYSMLPEQMEKFVELIIEDVLNEVKERAYYTGDRDWSDEVDRPWIQLEFGYGKLYDQSH